MLEVAITTAVFLVILVFVSTYYQRREKRFASVQGDALKRVARVREQVAELKDELALARSEIAVLRKTVDVNDKEKKFLVTQAMEAMRRDHQTKFREAYEKEFEAAHLELATIRREFTEASKAKLQAEMSARR